MLPGKVSWLQLTGREHLPKYGGRDRTANRIVAMLVDPAVEQPLSGQGKPPDLQKLEQTFATLLGDRGSSSVRLMA
jgi:hypothetical protein